MTYEKTFDDIKDHWARVDIEKMAAKFIAQGRDDKTFDPDSSISRSEFTALVVRALELKEKGKEQLPFEDIANDKWYHQELTQAYNSGIVLKTDGVSFRPEVDITREEMVVIITRALAKKIEISNYSEQEISKKLENFEDKYFIVDSAREAFAQCIDRGIVQGRSSTILAPKGNATRAEAIVIIKRVLDLI